MLVSINITITAQTKSQIEEVLKKIELEKFDN